MKKLVLMSLSLFLLAIGQIFAQTRTVTGVVTGKDDGLPIPGVSVRVTGTNTGTATNANGRYSINVSGDARSLDFNFIGYGALTANLGSNNVLNVSLSPDTKQLDEVVVLAGGLATTRRSQGTVATTIKSDQLTAAKPTNVAAGLLGKIPGLQINGTSGGSNPNFRIFLRGLRSLTGNNEALIVLDNVITPNAVLGNLNPEDIEDVQVLNGGSGAALYGSDASNGVIIIRTKRGQKGRMEIKAQQTFTAEQVAFYPQLQKQFGQGSDGDIKVYLGVENQQYGPAFDGVVREVGRRIPDGNGGTTIQRIPYAANNSREDFWNNGLTSQTDLSISSGDEKGTVFFSGQYARANGTTPKDIYDRANVRLNGTRNISSKLFLNYSLNYAQNRYDQTTQTATIYDQLLESSANIPVTDYKDWRNDPRANPSGYYNAYYNNPYFQIDNYRERIRNDYFNGSAELRFSPFKWMDVTYRPGISTRNNSGKSYSDIFNFSDLARSQAGSGEYKLSNIVGGVTDNFLYNTRFTNELQFNFKKKVSDFDFNLVVSGFMRQDAQKSLSSSISGLVVPGLFNLSNSTSPPTATESNFKARQQAVYGVLNIGYKNFLFVNATARNDWFSTLSPENRSFFYPSVNVSFVPTDAFSVLKEIKQLDNLKIRGAYSKVGNVNLPGTFGAYGLASTFSQGSGFPFNGQGGFTIDNRIVSNNLTPEFTTGYEFGSDAAFFNSRLTANFTYYKNKTYNQTVTTAVANTSGFTSYLLNAAQTTTSGTEYKLDAIPVRTKNFEVTVGANISHFNSNVDFITGVDQINLGSFTGAGSYAVVGRRFPLLTGRSYNRDPEGRIIVDRVTGYPTGTTTFQPYGSALPKDILGLTASATYKGFTISAVGEYRSGNYIYNAAGTTLDFNGSAINTVAYNRERFVIPNSSYRDAAGNFVANTNITVKDGSYGYWAQGSPRRNIDENYITSGAFWKIREISIGYTIPKSLLGRTKVIRSARISAQGRNLFIFLPKDNVYTDPEYSAGDGNSNGNAIGLTSLGQTPPSRFFGGTLSLTF